MKRFLIVFSLIILLFLTSIFIYKNFYISIDTYNTKTVEYGESINKISPTIKLTGKYFFKEGFVLNDKYLKEESFVNVNKLGTYKINYFVKFLVWENETTDTISVIDTKKPTITLKGATEVTILPIESYIDEGFEAYDNYDKDLTDSVVITEDAEKIFYSVADSSGNKETVYRIVHVNDPNPPEIKLIGNQEIDIYLNENYKEPGVSAFDDCAGDLTEKVTIESNLDTTKVGTYTIRYTATDNFKNSSSVERTVNVLNIPEGLKNIALGEPNGKTIYLTFDDGPGPYTEALLDVLAKYNVKATFFVLNHPKYNYILERMYKEGHQIGIHGYTHDYNYIYQSKENFYEDLQDEIDVIYNYTGQTPKILRFPGGSSNSVSIKICKGIMSTLAEDLSNDGYQYFDWNVSSGDAGKGATTTSVYKNVVKGISSHKESIVLQHDIKKFSVEAVESIIIYALQNGYTFSTLSPDSFYVHHKIKN